MERVTASTSVDSALDGDLDVQRVWAHNSHVQVVARKNFRVIGSCGDLTLH